MVKRIIFGYFGISGAKAREGAADWLLTHCHDVPGWSDIRKRLEELENTVATLERDTTILARRTR